MKAYYESLLGECGSILHSTFADPECERAHNAIYNRLADLTMLRNQLEGRSERSVFDASIKELEYSLLAVSLGLYRQAYSGLRLTLDLAVGCVFFSANEIDLRQWLSGKQNLLWSSITDDKTGVFSERFVSAFFSELTGRANQYKAMASTLHLECSKYVHGNALTHGTLPDELSFQRQSCLDWCEKADTAYLIIVFIYCVRYVVEMTRSRKTLVETIILESLSHLEPVRILFASGDTIE